MSSKSGITLDALLVIDTIQRQGSFAAAANALYRVPSAITYTIKKLEDDLNVTLFVKSGRQAKLTPAGQQLLDDGRALLAAADKLVENTKQVHSGWEPKLRIVIESILDISCFFPLIKHFQKENPHTELELFHEVLSGSWEALLEGKVDLLIGSAPYPKALPNIHTEVFGQPTWVFCCAPSHPLAQAPRPLSAASICQHLAIVVRDSSRQLPSMNSGLFDQQSKLTVSSVEDKIKAQLAGVGVGFLPVHRIRTPLKNGELIELALQDNLTNNKAPTNPLYLAWNEGNQGRALAWFTARLQNLDIL